MIFSDKYDNSGVRRQDRLLDRGRAEELLEQSEYGFLALGGESGYGVPLNFAYDGGRIYFHCAPEGEKLRRIAGCSTASFCVVGRTRPILEKFTTEYESVMASGNISVVADDDERMLALELIVAKYSPGFEDVGQKYAEKSFGRTAVLRLDVERISGKCKK